MSRTVFVNGSFVPESEAKISIFDRGFLFGDAVYEVTAVVDGQLVDNANHLERLKRSLEAVSIPLLFPIEKIEEIQRRLVEMNQVTEGLVYLQVTRGVQPDRNLYCQEDGLEASLIMFTQVKTIHASPLATNGIRVRVQEDPRWNRRDIKTTMLLPNYLAKNTAKKQGYDDTWMVQDGFVTEGSSSNAFIIQGDVLQTRPLSHEVLPGITRQALLSIAEEVGLTVEQEAFTVEQAQAANEAFASSSSTVCMPVVEIADVTIGDSKPGPWTTQIRQRYLLKFGRSHP